MLEWRKRLGWRDITRLYEPAVAQEWVQYLGERTVASAEEAITVFISYSRTDSEFVDRLEASLRARGFGTWVDRRRIEGGQDWLDEIQHAIDSCQRQVLVLSPAALESEFVRMEYRYARRIGKPLIPVLLLPCPTVPMDLPMIQWVDFQSDYDEGMKQLLIALTRETPLPVDVLGPKPEPGGGESDVLVVPSTNPSAQPPEMPLRELYTAGLAARARDDLERTAIFWDQIIERDPTFLDGTVVSEMEAIRPRLTPIRLRRLRETADAARVHGEWAQEVAAWQGVLALEPDDADAQTCLAIAQENRANEEQYDIARELVAKGDQQAARYQLKLLWARAKYYGDPAGIASGLGITVPPGYRDAQTQQQRQAQADEQATQLAARKAQRSVYRRDRLHLSLGVVLLCVFGSIVGVGVAAGGFAGNLLDADIIVFIVTIVFAVLSYALGAHRAAHPAAFWIVALLALGIAPNAMLLLWPPQAGYTAQNEPHAAYALPIFFYSDPFNGQHYYTQATGEALALENASRYCGDMSVIGLPSTIDCIFNTDPGNPNWDWFSCSSTLSGGIDCSQPIDVGTTAHLFGVQGSPPEFALPLALLWAILGMLVSIVRNAIRHRRLSTILVRITIGAVMGFIAGFALGAAIYTWGWSVASFLCASVFAFLYLVHFQPARFPFLISTRWLSRGRVVSLLITSGIFLVASLLLWGLFLHVAAFLLIPCSIASILGILWMLSMVGTVRMWITRPAAKQ